MELSELIFTAKTDDLERVSKVIGGLVTDISKLDKVSRDAAKTEATLARAAKDNAKANLDNAKAQDTLAKTMLNVDKAANAAAAATEKKAKATEKSTEATARQTSVLQKQKDILEFQTQGFSKGQAGILAYGKAAGLAANDIEELGKVLETQRKLMGGDPFDKSLSGLKSLQNQYTELKESVRQYATDSNLSAKQTRELARDKERIIEKMKVEGASFSDIRKAIRAHNDEYVNLASSYNKMASAEGEVIKSRKDAVAATNYLTQADAKMAAALNTSNAALDKAGTDSLVRYESALRKSGVSQDVATAKLATYKAQLTQVNALEQKRREQHLARALSPQLTDIGVSLYSGQAPLTVLLQQGGQIADLLRLSGVEAQNFGKALRDAFSSMIPVMATVAKGIGSFTFGLFYDAGKGITNFIANVTGMNKVLQHTDDILYLIGGRATWFSNILATLGTIASVTFGAGILAIVAGLASLAVGLKQVITENNDLAKAFALSGASIGLSHTQMIGYVKTLADSGATTGQATEALLAMAKAGNFTSSEILLVSDSAIQMQKGFGIAIEDTVKQFAKLKEKPVEALLEIAKSSGMVGPEVIKMVQELERAGKSTEAASVAMKAYADVTKQQVAQMKENYNGFALFMIDLGQKIKQFFSDTFKTLFLATDPNQQLEDQLVKLRERIKEVSGNLQSLGSFGDPKLLNQLKEQERMLISQIGANVRIRGEEEKRKYLNAENAKYESAIASLRGNALDAIEKETRKTQTLAEFRKSFINDKLKEAAKEKSVDIEKLKLNTDLMNVLQQQADIEYKKTQKSGGSKSENYYATLMREATNNTIAANTATQELTKSEQKLLEVKADPRFAKLTAIQQADVIAKYDAAIAAERQTAMTEKLAEAEEHRLKLLGKSEGIGKQYYADMQKLEEFAKVAGWSREEIEELTRAVFKQTPAWKAYEKALEDVNTASKKFQEDSLASQASVLQENQSLDHRLSLLGRTAEEQKAITIEYQRANKIREVDIKLARQLREIEEKIAEAKKKGLPESDYKSLIDAEIQARKDAAEQHKVINREVAVQYAEDMQREIDAIKSGISDSIVTALFEGGKAGSKKLRDVLVNTLRQKVTIVVDAVVNTLVGNVVGSLMGGAGGQAGASLLGSAASSAAGSMLGGATGLLGSVGGALSGFTTAATASLQTMVGMTGTVAQMSTSLAAAGHTAAAGMQAGINAFQMIPGWGWALAAVGALAAIFGKKSTPHTGAGSTYSFAGGLQTGADQYGQYGFADTRNYNSETEKVTSSLAKSVVTMLDQTAKNFGMTAGYQAATAFADDTSKDGAWGSLVIEQLGKKVIDWSDSQVSKWAPKVFSDGEKGLKEYMNAVANSAIEALQKMDLPAWASRIAQTTELGTDNAEAALNNLFKALSEYPNQLLQLFGTSRDALVEKFTEGLASGNAMQAGQSVADVLVESIRNALYTNAAGQIFDIVNQGIVAPVLDAIVTGASVSEALSDASIQATIDRAKKQAQVLAELYGNTEFQAVLENLRVTVGSALGQAGTSIQTLPNTLYKVADAAEDTARAAEELAQKEADLTRKRLEMYKQIYTLEGKQAEARLVEVQLRGLELAAMDASLRPLQEMIYALEDFAEKVTAIKNHLSSVSEEANRLLGFARSNTDKVYAVLERSVGKQLDIAKTAVETSTKVRDSLKGIFDLLSENIRALYGEVDSTSAMLSSEGRSIITQAISSGVIPEQDKLSEAISAVRSGLDKTIYTTKFQADKARLLFGIELSNLQETAKDQLTEAERQLKASEDTVKYLEGVLTTAKAQIDALRGIDLSVINVETAINNLAAAILAEGSLQGAKNKLLLQGTGQAVYDVTSGTGTNAAGQVFERNALIEATQSHLAQGTTQAALDVYRAAASSGYSMSQLETIYGLPSGVLATEIDKLSQAVGIPLPGFASGGYTGSGGMFEPAGIVHKNEVVFSQPDIQRLGGVSAVESIRTGSSSNDEEVQALRAEVRAVVTHVSKLSRNIERLIVPTGDGEALQTKAVV